MYQPTQPFNVAGKYFVPTYTIVNGVRTKAYSDGVNFFCSAKGFGGTEKVIDGVYVIEDTMTLETWYIGGIDTNCKVKLLDDDSEWEVLNVEDVERKHLYTIIKVKRIKANA